MSHIKLRIGTRLIAGFAALCAVLCVAVGYTISVIGGVTPTIDRMVNLRVLVALESTELVNVGEAAKGTAMVASNITDVNRGAGETGSASSQVLSSAQSLSSESNHLKLEVDKFLSTARAA